MRQDKECFGAICKSVIGPAKASALENAVLGLCNEGGDFASLLAVTSGKND